MNNQLSKDFGVFSLLKFAFPTMIMMVFTSLYTIVDGIFVSRYVGSAALSAINIVYPLISIGMAFGIMLATGGSAIIARKMGEGHIEEARKDFTMITVVGFLTGILITGIFMLFLDPLLRMLGATDNLMPYCKEYVSLLLWFAPFFMLQLLFQTFFVTAGKPGLGLLITTISGVANAVLDFVFIAILDMGIAGAAWGTVVGYMIPAIAGLIYFLRPKGVLRFVKFKMMWRTLLMSCANGSSEMVTNLAAAVTTWLFNLIMIRFLGEDGVAAITIVLYSQFLFTALFLGFSGGVAPVFSYNYGSGNDKMLKRVFKISMGFVGIFSVLMFGAALLFAPWIVQIFTPTATSTYPIALHGFYLFSFSYIFSGANIFASSFFTALSDGRTSAIISFFRTFGFIVAGLLLLPLWLQADGVWLAVPVAELVSFGLAAWCIVHFRKKYRYL